MIQILNHNTSNKYKKIFPKTLSRIGMIAVTAGDD
jgi:hypothetical protein